MVSGSPYPFIFVLVLTTYSVLQSRWFRVTYGLNWLIRSSTFLSSSGSPEIEVSGILTGKINFRHSNLSSYEGELGSQYLRMFESVEPMVNTWKGYCFCILWRFHRSSGYIPNVVSIPPTHNYQISGMWSNIMILSFRWSGVMSCDDGNITVPSYFGIFLFKSFSLTTSFLRSSDVFILHRIPLIFPPPVLTIVFTTSDEVDVLDWPLGVYRNYSLFHSRESHFYNQ